MRKKISLALLFLFLIHGFLYARKVYYGYSSWYGDKFHGRKTASGEVYDMNKLTAAHRELPFHTYLKVTNLQNNKTVIVKVNDRGPYKHNRIIDLSRAAAQKLDFIGEGLTRVRIEVLGEPDEKTMNENAFPKEGTDPVTMQNSTREKTTNKTYANTKKTTKRTNNNYNNTSQNRKKKEVHFPDYDDEHYYNSELDRSKKMPQNNKRNKNQSLNRSNLQNTNKMNIVEKKYFGSIKYFLVDTAKLTGKNKRLFKVQLGAFSNIKYAANQQNSFNQKGVNTLLCLFKSDTRFYRLLSKESFYTETKAKEHIESLDQKGIYAFILEIK